MLLLPLVPDVIQLLMPLALVLLFVTQLTQLASKKPVIHQLLLTALAWKQQICRQLIR